jgi:hypothetical protein
MDPTSPWSKHQQRYWAFTHNNYTEEEYGALHGVCEVSPDVKYYCCGKEVGESGTPHMQGIICYSIPRRFNWVKNWLGQILPDCHIEPVAAPKVKIGCSYDATDYPEKYGLFDLYSLKYGGTCKLYHYRYPYEKKDLMPEMILPYIKAHLKK